ncbi:ABC transporter substrate-binding protein [Pseudomonas chlororaphis]|uniref:ABC transporter substrate-binding protein n=1 Tax=Pseudomonas chlororaphis TaxID=587753 RepID=UPI0023671E5D|nr:ABC transporter substrate-binding protein [Pseudomonas chlororaphis]WDH19966.1 ABC transporter substrate-binding protein [Pseudomonas chlororaphis]
MDEIDLLHGQSSRTYPLKQARNVMSERFKNGMRNLLGACALMAAGVAVAAQPSAGMKAEPGMFKIGVEPWLGYGQLHVAAAHDLYRKQGLETVSIVNFSEDKDINAALASGQIDAATIATHTAMGMVAAGLPVKIVLMLDQSMTADAIIAAPEIKSLKELKGKQVAFEEGTTSDILLHSALASAGMLWSDIQPVPMPASTAGAALIAGKVPVAVTYEPYLSAAKQQNAKVNMLYSGKDDPGIISDVLVVRDSVLEERPGQVLAMIKAWDAALSHYQNNTQADRAVIAKAVGSTAADMASAFDGVHFYSLADNQAQLSHGFSHETFAHILKSATAAGLIQQSVDATKTIDARFVEALK